MIKVWVCILVLSSTDATGGRSVHSVDTGSKAECEAAGKQFIAAAKASGLEGVWTRNRGAWTCVQVTRVIR